MASARAETRRVFRRPAIRRLGQPNAPSPTPTTGGRYGAWRAVRRWGIGVLAAAVILYGLWRLLLVAVRLITNHLWFASVGDSSVYTTMLAAQVVLFCVFGAAAALIGGLTAWAVHRAGQRLPVDPHGAPIRAWLRRYEPRLSPPVVAVAAIVPAILVGSRATGIWQSYLLWEHTTPWHRSDPVFHLDISFFVEQFPLYLQVVALLSTAVVYAVWIAVIIGYLYGHWRVRGGRQKVTRGIITVLSSLLAGYLALKAVGYWLSTYALTTSQTGPVTGASYADVHAGLPSRYVMAGITLVCALILATNVLTVRRTRALIASIVVMVLAVGIVGRAWPDLEYQLREAPSAAEVDLPLIADNQHATEDAFGLNGSITTIPYHAPPPMSSTSLVQLSRQTAQIPLLDPNQMSPSFNVNQQLQAYYHFPSTLDLDHYQLGGISQDVAIAARELNIGGIPGSSWVNDHLVYTHGYGVVAAPTTAMDPQTESPDFLDGGIPPEQQIPLTRPQIYYGMGYGPASYAIVGQPPGSHENLEFDHPGEGGSAKSALTTYHGGGGIPVGSLLQRFLFAVRLGSPNVLFSSELTSASQLLMIRNVRTRVQTIAPWLTLDGDVYPAVVDGRIDWIVDGYTTSARYPDSELVNLQKATETTLTADGSSITQPSQQINYMRNSVKAVVDAYSGTVTLYAWDQKQHPDPLLTAWESIFPGLVKPQSSIPPALLGHLRYPTDLFNMQRYLLARYHVKSPADFYSGNNFWKVPTDPTVQAAATLNSTSAQTVTSPPMPSTYITMSADGFGGQQYSLSSSMVTLNGRELAGFIYVDAQPGPDYGKFTVLDFPSSTAGGQSPLQVENDIESDTKISEALTLQRGGDSEVVLGNLAAIPLAGRMLYVEPVYTRSNSTNSFPILRHVIAVYANGDPSFENSLGPALSAAIDSASGTS